MPVEEQLDRIRQSCLQAWPRLSQLDNRLPQAYVLAHYGLCCPTSSIVTLTQASLKSMTSRLSSLENVSNPNKEQELQELQELVNNLRCLPEYAKDTYKKMINSRENIQGQPQVGPSQESEGPVARCNARWPRLTGLNGQLAFAYAIAHWGLASPEPEVQQLVGNRIREIESILDNTEKDILDDNASLEYLAMPIQALQLLANHGAGIP